MPVKKNKINFLDHVALEVRDLNKAIDFYTEIMGLDLMDTPKSVKENGVQWLHLNDQQAVHLVENSEMKPENIAHVALNVDDVSEWRKTLEAQGVEITPAKFNMYRAERFFILDPSGNRIEILKWNE